MEDKLEYCGTDDLLSELSRRKDYTNDELAKALTDNLADRCKMEEFLEVYNNIRQDELSEFLNKYK